eukprot:SAG22_NODE_576_length_8982_cov_21.167736_5_plen_259_part_00
MIAPAAVIILYIILSGAISGIQGSHNYTHTSNDTVRAALNQGGVDVNCGSDPAFYTQNVCKAVAHGSVNMTDVDRAARRLWKTMMKLGMFDPVEPQPLARLGPETVDSPAARALAKRTATEGIVLLKNTASFLPMNVMGASTAASAAGKKLKLGFVGPHINTTEDLLSAPQYHGQNKLVSSHSMLLVAAVRGWQVTAAKGVNICDTVRLPVLSVCLSVCLSICLPVRPSVCLSVGRSVGRSVRLSVCLSVCLSVRLSD